MPLAIKPQMYSLTDACVGSKLRIPSFVVRRSRGCADNYLNMNHQYPSSRPPRLEKQEEFEVEDDVVYMPSPVTIQIEDRGSGVEEGSGGEIVHGINGDQTEILDSKEGSGDEVSGETTETVEKTNEEETKTDRKVSGRVKLLVRSQAVHDDASPPPDLDTVIANSNMLSVTNAPAFATQTQSKSPNKNRLGRQGSSQGSQGSTESSSGLSRDSSTETYTDSTGIDLQQFIIDTLHKNQKDRITMFKIEQDLIALIKDSRRHTQKFGQMSSYNRMLVHRVAAFFGLDHYVDPSGTAVVVNKTKSTRIPDSRFQDYCRDELFPEEPKKSILKRDSISFEEGKEQKSPDRQSSTDSRRSKSFEEREEEYEKARARIFNQDDLGLGESPVSRRSSQEDIRWPSSDTRPWSSTDSDSSGRPLGAKAGSSFETEPSAAKADRPMAVISKDENQQELLIPNRTVRPVMKKASSFGGISVLSREVSGGKNATPKITKAESFNMTTLSDSVSLDCDASHSLQPEVTASSTSSPLLVSSSTDLQPTCPSQMSTSNSQNTFPLVAGQPTQLHIPTQSCSSQFPGWPAGSADPLINNDFTGQTAVGQHPIIWPVTTAPDLVFPSGILISPQAGIPCVNLENVVYRYKIPSNSGDQTVVLAPFPQITMPTPNQVPISSNVSVSSSVSPPNQQQQPPHQGQTTNVQLNLTSQQQNSSPPSVQQQTVHLTQSQPPAIVYVPYIPSQIQQPLLPQPSGASSTGVQNVQQQVQPQSSPQSLVVPDQRTYSANPSSSVDELNSQITLNLMPSHISLAQSQEAQPSAPRNIVNIDSSVPQNFVIPAYKSQGFPSPQGNMASFPIYYMPQVQQTSNVHQVRYVFPSNPSISQQPAPSHGQNVGITSQMVSDVQSHNSQNNSQVTGRAEQSKYARTPHIHGMTLSHCRPTSGLVCQRSVPIMQDVCLIGHPLQHHFSPLMFSPQRPISRFIHPLGSNTLPSMRPPKNRNRRGKGGTLSGCVSGASSSARHGASFQLMQDVPANHILEIEGLPDGMKRNEIERYLELVTCHGATIKFLDAETGHLLPSDTDFIMCSRHLVVAVFESDTAAQSALLGIKTPKFQLRPPRRSASDVSQKKFS